MSDTSEKKYNDAVPVDPFITKLLNTKAITINPIPQLTDEPAKTLISIDKHTTVKGAMEILSKHKILGAPVVSKEKKKYIDVIDMIRLVSFITGNISPYNSNNYNSFISELNEKDTLANSQIEKLLYDGKTYGNVISSNTSLMEAFEILAKGAHRVIVVDKSKSFETMLTQSNALEYIHKNIELINPKLRYQQVKEIRILGDPLCINETEKVLFGFNVLIENQVSGIGVIDKNGKLVESLSIRDLSELKYEQEKLWSLYGDIKKFKESKVEKYPTICVSLEDTLETCINMIAKFKVHRVFAVDANKSPLKCISIKDILSNILF